MVSFSTMAQTNSSFLLPSILTVFLSQEWKHLTCESVVVRQKRGHSWFRSSGTIKKFRARLSIWLTKARYVTVWWIQRFCCWVGLIWSQRSLFLTVSRSGELQERPARGRIISPAMKINRANSYTINNPPGDLFTYTPSGKVNLKHSSERFSWVFYGYGHIWNILSMFLLLLNMGSVGFNHSACVSSLTEGGGVCGKVVSTAQHQTADRAAFLHPGHQAL